MNATRTGIETRQYLNEGIALKSVHKLMVMVRSINGTDRMMKFFGGKLNQFGSIHRNTVNAVDDIIFGGPTDDGSSSEESPPKEPAQKKKTPPTKKPKTKQETESFMYEIWEYIKNIIPNISWEEVRKTLRVVWTVVARLIHGAGLVTSGILMGPYGFGIVAASCVILTLLSIFNAYWKTKNDTNSAISLLDSAKNVLEGFKKYFTSLEVQRYENKFTILSVFMLAVLYAAVAYISPVMVTGGIGAVIGFIIGAAMKGVGLGTAIGALTGVGAAPIAVTLVSVFCAITILYLFAQMVDEFALKKLKNKDNEES